MDGGVEHDAAAVIVEEDDVYGVLSNTRMLIKSKLYEIETLLEHKNFIRISKYCLVNIGKIDYIKPALNFIYRAV